MSKPRVALIRGINVGRAKRVAMADLRAALERAGFADVRTLLNSGNVVFTSALTPRRAAARIERAMEQELGVAARALVLTAAELEAAVKGNRLARVATNPSRLVVAFLWEPAPGLHAVRRRDWGEAAIAVGPRVAYLWCPAGFDTPLLEAFHQAVGTGVTLRNWSTVLKLHGSLQADGPPVRRGARAPAGRPARRPR